MSPHILQVSLLYVHSPSLSPSKLFLRLCLAATIEHSDAPKVKCPFKDEDYSCDMEMLEREIKEALNRLIMKMTTDRQKMNKKGMIIVRKSR